MLDRSNESCEQKGKLEGSGDEICPGVGREGGGVGGAPRSRKEGDSHLFLTTLSLRRVPRAGWGAPIPIWGGHDLKGRQTGIT